MTISELNILELLSVNEGQRTLSTTGTIRQKEFTLAFLSISLMGLMATAALETIPSALGQTTTSPAEKKDVFKVIMTVHTFLSE